jgi:hypothetical protein
MPSKTSEFRAMVSQEFDVDIAAGHGVKASEVTNRVLDAFTDEDFKQLGIEQARGIVHDMSLQKIASTRSGRQSVIPSSASSVAEKRLQKAQRTWDQWLEFNGERHLQYMKMTRDDLLSAATIRRSRGEREIHLASLHELVAQGLNADQTVEEVYTEEQIERLSSGIKVRYATTWDDVLGEFLSLKGDTPESTAAD